MSLQVMDALSLLPLRQLFYRVRPAEHQYHLMLQVLGIQTRLFQVIAIMVYRIPKTMDSTIDAKACIEYDLA